MEHNRTIKLALDIECRDKIVTELNVLMFAGLEYLHYVQLKIRIRMKQ